MIETWRTIVWQQFGAAIDMLGNAIRACPADHWQDAVWDDPTDAPGYTEFWFISYHCLAWLERYLAGAPAVFAPPPPFVRGRLPDQPYTQAEVLAYFDQCREKCRVIFAALTDEEANRPCRLPWEGGEELSFAELQLYNMRHVQEHAAQLSLHLGRATGSAPDWVVRAEA